MKVSELFESAKDEGLVTRGADLIDKIDTLLQKNANADVRKRLEKSRKEFSRAVKRGAMSEVSDIVYELRMMFQEFAGSLKEAKELPAHLIPRWPGKAIKVSGLEDFKDHMIQIGGTKKIANDEKKRYHAKGGKICGIYDPITSTGVVYMPTVKEDLNEGFEAELADAVKLNWLSWPNSKIVSLLKRQIAAGKWSALKNKSDDELHDYVDNAKDDARNQVDEGVTYQLDKAGVKHKLKGPNDHEGIEKWKNYTPPKREAGEKAEKYSEEWWTYKESADETVPWTRIEPMDDSDEVKRIIDDQFGKINTDWTYGKKSEVKRDNVPCAAVVVVVVVRVMYEIGPDDDMGVDEPTQDTQSILVARNPKNPKKLDFIQYV